MQHELIQVRRPCLKYLRQMIKLKQLNAYPFLYWTCPPDFSKVTPARAGALKLNGYEKGNFDLTIIAANSHEIHVWLIEFKYGRNGYTDEQKAIAEACQGTQVNALKIYSLDEFVKFVDTNLR